jgi:K+-sensing histidine kinase KdpD
MKEPHLLSPRQEEIKRLSRKQTLDGRKARGPCPDLAPIVHDLKNSMTMLLLSVGSLKGYLSDTSVCRPELVKDIEDMTFKMNLLIENLVALFWDGGLPIKKDPNHKR